MTVEKKNSPADTDLHHFSPAVPQFSPAVPQFSPAVPQFSPAVPQFSPAVPQFSPAVQQNTSKSSTISNPEGKIY